MVQSTGKKRKAEEPISVFEDVSDMAQSSEFPLPDSSRHRVSVAIQTSIQTALTKRRKITHAKGNVPQRLAANDSSDDVGSRSQSAHGTADEHDSMDGEDYAAGEEEDSAKEEPDPAKAAERLRVRAIVFNPVPRPAITPWHHNFAAPTPTYEDQETCPIDWSKVTAVYPLAVECQQYYELRRPWHEQPVPWDKIAAMTPRDPKDPKKMISPEGGRKRFMMANRAVFELTGVYFPMNSLGLYENYGIPLYGVLKPLLQGTSAAPATREIKVATNRSHDSGEAIQLVVFPPGQKSAFNRFVTKEVMERLPIHDLHYLRYSLVNFDRWYTSVFQGHRHTFPKRIYSLEPWMGETFTHRDHGTPSTAISDLLEVYRLSQEMGTTDVSDMVLDEIVLSFMQEDELINKYEEGKATIQDCDMAIRSMSFDLGDISLLWENTEGDDPIHRLMFQILYHWIHLVEDDIEKQQISLNPDFVRDWKRFINRPGIKQCDIVQKFIYEGKGYKPMGLQKSFAPGKTRNETIGQRKKNLLDFCRTYHNHWGNTSQCFRSKPQSPNLIPEGADEPRKVKVRFGAVDLRIENRANHKAVTFDFERLVERKPEWDWQRIRSIAAYVEGPLDPESGARSYRLEPTYYELDTVDAYGRYPCHPGYQDPKWVLPDPEIEEPDAYDEPWEKVIKRDIPKGASRYRETKIPAGVDEHGKTIYKVTEVFFEIEDPDWYPPKRWKPDMKSCGVWPQEFREYRRWLWTEEGGTIPRVEVQRFRPFEGGGPSRKDSFVDRKDKVSVLDIFR